jgi:DNA polymerase-3 subunit epsilon
VVPVLLGSGAALLLRAAGAMSAPGRSVGRVTQDTPTLLFELEAQPTETAHAVEVVSTWTPPVAAPLTQPVPLPLLDEPAAPAATETQEPVVETVEAEETLVETVEVRETLVEIVEVEETVVPEALVETAELRETDVAEPVETPAAEAPASAAPVVGETRPHSAPVRIGDVVAALEIEVETEAVVQVVEPAAPEAAAPERPLPAWARALGVFDLETTGVDTATARIVTAHVGLIDETGAVVERKDWIVNPGVPIPEGAAAVHGITDERAKRFGRPPGEVIAEILAAIRSVFARGFPLVVYNAPYDLTLLAAEADRHRLWRLEATAPIVDPFVLDKQIDRYRKGKRTLSAASEVYGVALTDAHDAGADAIAAGRLAQAMARRFPEELELTAQELHDAQVGWCADQAERFQAYMREKRDPSFTTSGAWPSR